MPLTHDIGVRIPYPLQKALKFSAFIFFLAISTATFKIFDLSAIILKDYIPKKSPSKLFSFEGDLSFLFIHSRCYPAIALHEER